jgi:hypothetical protein
LRSLVDLGSFFAYFDDGSRERNLDVGGSKRSNMDAGESIIPGTKQLSAELGKWTD